MGELRGFAAVTDNVLRMRDFLNDHPDVSITHHREPAWFWAGVWYDAGVRREVTSPELGSLLDVLHAMLSQTACTLP